MAIIFEKKAILILAGNLNSGYSYPTTTVHSEQIHLGTYIYKFEQDIHSLFTLGYLWLSAQLSLALSWLRLLHREWQIVRKFASRL